MEPLSWTGALSILNWPLIFCISLFCATQVVRGGIYTVSQFLKMSARNLQGIDPKSLFVRATDASRTALLWAIIAVLLIYIVLGAALNFDAGIVGALSRQLMPAWLVLTIIFILSHLKRRQLGIYGKIFDSNIAMVGFALVLFWILVGLFGAVDLIGTHDALDQLSGMKNKKPGTALTGSDDNYPYYLLGGDNLARDVFSRVVKGAFIVVQIAPLAALFSFMVGIVLGLPAGYIGGWLDLVLSFIANLILAFPVILLFYLLVTPEIISMGIPQYLAAILFIFPIFFFLIMFNSKYHTRPGVRAPVLGIGLLILGWLYLSFISEQNAAISFLPAIFDGFDVPKGIFVVFVSVVFINSPIVFRIVRGLTMDIKTRDFVAAARTRGEGVWYIMLWEILPNVRGPLIVDFCLRIGYTTILLGTLGFFGLGLPPESPDWGSTINEGRKLLAIYPHPALPPAFALMSLVLGLNLLADGLREESLKD